MLDVADRHHPNIRLVRHIGKQVPFLDVLIENNQGTLITSVYRKEAAEPYLVPFNSDHPRHIFRNIVEGMLARAIRYSSTMSAFDTERRSIQLMLLYNGFVTCFVSACRCFLSRLSSADIHPDTSRLECENFSVVTMMHRSTPCSRRTSMTKRNTQRFDHDFWLSRPLPSIKCHREWQPSQIRRRKHSSNCQRDVYSFTTRSNSDSLPSDETFIGSGRRCSTTRRATSMIDSLLAFATTETPPESSSEHGPTTINGRLKKRSKNEHARERFSASDLRSRFISPFQDVSRISVTLN